MTDGVDREHHLEQVLFRLLDYQSRPGVDRFEAMLMLSLLNLLGMVDVMSRQAPATGVQGAPALSSPNPNPMEALLGMLAKGAPGVAPGGSAGGAPPFNPAMLMQLMNMMNMFKPPGKEGPDMAGMLKMLSSMMGGPGATLRPPPAKPAVSSTQQEPEKDSARPAPGRVRDIKAVPSPGAAAEKESGRAAHSRQVIKWGQNLDKGRRA